MAFAVWLRGLPGRGSEGWAVDGVPWPTALRHDPRFREVGLNDGYLDFIAVLTVAEAQAINAGCLNSGYQHLDEIAVHVQNLLATATPSRLVVACIYEWESGLGD